MLIFDPLTRSDNITALKKKIELEKQGFGAVVETLLEMTSAQTTIDEFEPQVHF